jgi:hypothetical protein
MKLRFLARPAGGSFYEVHDRPCQAEATALARREHRQQRNGLFVGDWPPDCLDRSFKRLQLGNFRIPFVGKAAKRNEFSDSATHAN